jgi:hypothetical protein
LFILSKSSKSRGNLPLTPSFAKRGSGEVKKYTGLPLLIDNLLYSHAILDIINSELLVQHLYNHERITGYNQMASYYKKGSGNAWLE